MTQSRARELRWKMTDAERVLWSMLRRKQLDRFRFRRQAPIGPYFADFLCLEARLIVEVDGAHHFQEENLWRDYSRAKWLESEGFRVIRFTNDEVFRSSADVAQEIRRVLLECVATPLPAANRTRKCVPCVHLPPQGGKVRINCEASRIKHAECVMRAAPTKLCGHYRSGLQPHTRQLEIRLPPAAPGIQPDPNSRDIAARPDTRRVLRQNAARW